MKRALKKRYATGLAAIRHQHGYSQAAFAQLLGVSKSVLSMAECGLRSLPSSILFKITDLELEREWSVVSCRSSVVGRYKFYFIHGTE